MRGFAEYLRDFDPETEVPPRDLLPDRHQWVAPYVYSAADIDALMTTTRDLKIPLRAATYETLIGLLAVTGLRLEEDLAMGRGKLDEKQLLLVARRAKGGGRKVPVA